MKEKNLYLTIILVIIFSFSIQLFSQKGGQTTSVDLRPEKKMARLGEAVEIHLSNFFDAAGNKAGRMHPLVIFALRDKLEGGMSFTGMVPVTNGQMIKTFKWEIWLK